MGTVTVATMSIAWTNITAAIGHTIFDIMVAMVLGLAGRRNCEVVVGQLTLLLGYRVDFLRFQSRSAEGISFFHTFGEMGKVWVQWPPT